MRSDAGGGLAYRPDIDGLRAVAVLSVALYHAEIAGFSGGFVGVDVFFVISGYLITRIVVERAERGAFSLLGFYEARARRILPALLVVATAVLGFTLAFRSPADADAFGENLVLFAAFASNFFFYDELDYFADPVEYYMLLHTWSLAVEEQFYLFFPPAVVWALAGGRRRLAGLVLGVVGLSFLACVIATALDPRLAFFHTPFRVWQLGLGGLLAVAPPRFGQATREAAGAAGLGAIAIAVALYDDTTPFPGAAAAAPTLGAAALIAAGPASRVGRALSAAPLVFVGLASYSFYLWHWPALSAARYLSTAPLTAPESLGVLAAAFALAVLSLYAVERPFRRPGGVLSRAGVFAASAASIAGLVVIGTLLQESRGWPERFPHLAPMFTADARRSGPDAAHCPSALDALPVALVSDIDPGFCRAPAEAAADAEPVLLIGDSHAFAIAPGLAERARAEGRVLYVAWSPVCPPLERYDRPVATRFHDCARHNTAAFAAVEALGARRVVLAAQWSRYSAEPGFAAMLAASVARLRADGATVTIVDEAPPLPFHPPFALFRAAVAGVAPDADLGPAALFAPIADRLVAYEAAVAPLGVRRWSLADALCSAGLCRIQAADGAPYYADGHHLSRVGARAAAAALPPW